MFLRQDYPSHLPLVLTHLLSIILPRTSLLLEVSTPILPGRNNAVRVYVCIVCGRVACARVAIPSDCQRGSWEIYCMGQTTGFLYHFSRFLFFSPIQESDYHRRYFLWLYSLSLGSGFPHCSCTLLINVQLSQSGLS